MGFLPKDYEAPKGSSNYLKLEEGQNKFRIVSDAVIGYEYWTDANKPVRLKEHPTTKPTDIRVKDDGSYEVKHFWAFIVLDRKDAKVKILEITQASIMRNIEELFLNEEWGDPKQYDLNISRTGSGMETRYTVQPSPTKELTKEEKSLVARMEIDLNALFEGENPFDGVKVETGEKTPPQGKSEATDDSGEVKMEDIPF